MSFERVLLVLNKLEQTFRSVLLKDHNSIHKMSSVPTLGYFQTRGLAQPIRLVLHYAGVPFNDKRHQFGAGTTVAEMDSIKKDWLAEKFTLGLDFPNIPYFIDGDLKLTQSLAILRHLARKHGLMATDLKSLAQQDMVEQQLSDLRTAFGTQLIFNRPDDKEKEQKIIDDVIVPHLKLLSNFLGDKEWFVGSLTYVDFIAYEMLDMIRTFNPKTLDQFPALKSFMTRFEGLEPIKKYMSSPEFISWPFTGPFAKWGYHK